ncbi:DinB family protein [Flavobacterium supellecticarium]|uniref:DinB family protein n=1 Tax=Flavobacterium supellecticarium TaxID=2565924 RepID=A0A4S4A5B1_9FLAO|nr:DinB family protein [Flavobacterium supellecticarium]THF53125.1 DinB family protein [Flavobacterium supellecticarium]
MKNALSKQIAKHFRDLHFGGNWTSVSLKEALEDINWEQATTKVYDLNTIAVLVYHVNYYVSAVLKVLEGEPLDASDKLSFNLPPISSEAEWEALKNKTFSEAEQFAARIEQLDDTRFFEEFIESKYGNYYRNITGIIEHTHYHLGQISLIRKMLPQTVVQ